MRTPLIAALVSPSVTCAVRFGSIRQFGSSFGCAATTTLPRMSAVAFMFLILMLPICLATLPPSRLPSAPPSASRTLFEIAPLTVSVPVSGVDIVSLSWAPVAATGPRAALHLMSAFCSSCGAGLSAVPAKLRGVARSAASRIALNVKATGATMVERRGGDGGKGGSAASAGVGTAPRGAMESMILRAATKDTAMAATPARIVVRRMISPLRGSGTYITQGGGQSKATSRQRAKITIGRHIGLAAYQG